MHSCEGFSVLSITHGDRDNHNVYVKAEIKILNHSTSDEGAMD